ncbi:MAG TPA: hypothetical protein ENJ41_06115 [Oceanospirillales bacterium]|nr:hypothetical protein [Oceanospirillales bacterium]
MKQLPEKIALDKAVHGQRLYQGSVEIQQMSRLLDLLADASGEVKFSIQFNRAAKVLGQAQVKVSADLPLICTISQKKFMFPVAVDSTIGFIDDLAYEDRLGVDMEASWVEEGWVKPLEIIEDELILAVPDAPFDESHSLADEEGIEVTEQVSNPFAVLNSLKEIK